MFLLSKSPGAFLLWYAEEAKLFVTFYHDIEIG